MQIPPLLLSLLLISPAAPAQLAQRAATTPQAAPAAPHRTRLILKDGSYQIVMSYTVVGTRVRFISAERAGETEEIPLALVDLPATQLWDKQHAPPDPNASPDGRPAPTIDPELLKEEADRATLSPEVAPALRLPPEDPVLVLDTFRATPDLVPLVQSQGDLKPQAAHNTIRALVNPRSAPHSLIVLKNEKSDVQLHVPDPAFYLKLDDELPSSGQALTVDTHGAAAQAGTKKLSPNHDYVIVRLDVRQDARVLASFDINALGTAKHQEDVVETTPIVLPGGHWLKLVPTEQLLIGEYALMEILNGKEVNLGVWDFGVHPTAPENRDLIKPEPRRPATLNRNPNRPPQ